MNIVATVTQAFWKTTLVLQKHSPTILTSVGVVGVVGTAVLAGKATIKAVDVIEDTKDELDKIEEAKEIAKPGTYTDEDAIRDRRLILAKTVGKLGKVYLPTLLVGATTIGCFVGSHNVLKARNVALTLSYKALDSAFKRYRGKVQEAIGEEKENAIYRGVKVKNIKGKTEAKEVEIVDNDPLSIYSRWFDSSNMNWVNQAHYNDVFLRAKQNYFNDILNIKGYVFLNEVLEELGFEPTPEGQLVGWLSRKKGTEADGFIDFGLSAPDNAAFNSGDLAACLLDFNVDGIMYDMI